MDPVIAYLLYGLVTFVIIGLVGFGVIRLFYRLFKWAAKDTYDTVHRRNAYWDDWDRHHRD